MHFLPCIFFIHTVFLVLSLVFFSTFYRPFSAYAAHAVLLWPPFCADLLAFAFFFLDFLLFHFRSFWHHVYASGFEHPWLLIFGNVLKVKQAKTSVMFLFTTSALFIIGFSVPVSILHCINLLFFLLYFSLTLSTALFDLQLSTIPCHNLLLLLGSEPLQLCVHFEISPHAVCFVLMNSARCACV